MTDPGTELLDLAFQVRGNAPLGSTPLTIDGSLNANLLVMTPVDGSITVMAAPAPVVAADRPMWKAPAAAPVLNAGLVNLALAVPKTGNSVAKTAKINDNAAIESLAYSK